MKILSVDDESFSSYGRVIHLDNIKDIADVLEKTKVKEGCTIYCPEDEELMKCKNVDYFKNNIFGGMEIQLGYCNGFNTKLNCLEYHKTSEVNYSNESFILLLAKKEDIISGELDTSKVKAFKVEKDTIVEIYSTTLHYAPCQTKRNQPFKVLVILPKGTNTPIDKVKVIDEEDKYLWMKNKWLLAHKDSQEAKENAYVGLVGENIDIIDII